MMAHIAIQMDFIWSSPYEIPSPVSGQYLSALLRSREYVLSEVAAHRNQFHAPISVDKNRVAEHGTSLSCRLSNYSFRWGR